MQGITYLLRSDCKHSLEPSDYPIRSERRGKFTSLVRMLHLRVTFASYNARTPILSKRYNFLQLLREEDFAQGRVERIFRFGVNDVARECLPRVRSFSLCIRYM